MTSPAEPDLWLGGRLSLLQPARGAHRAGTDTVLLSRLLSPEPGKVLCDVGAATGAVGLAYASLFPDCRVVLVEKSAELAEMARANAAANGLAERARICEADVLAPGRERAASGLVSGLADCLVTNPPFFERGSQRASPHPGKASAHGFGENVLGENGLEQWLRSCCDLLRPGGAFGMIHRADHLPPCLDAMGRRFGAIAVRPVHARADQPAIRVLISAVKGSRARFSLLPPLVLHDASGAFTPEVQALHRGETF